MSQKNELRTTKLLFTFLRRIVYDMYGSRHYKRFIHIVIFVYFILVLLSF